MIIDESLIIDVGISKTLIFTWKFKGCSHLLQGKAPNVTQFMLEFTVDPSPETTEVDVVDDVASILIYRAVFRRLRCWFCGGKSKLKLYSNGLSPFDENIGSDGLT